MGKLQNSPYFCTAVLGYVEAEEDSIANGTHDSCKSDTTIAGNERKSAERPEEKITEKPQEKKPRTLEEMLRLYKKTK